MKNSRKTTALFLSLVLVIGTSMGVLTSCGGGDISGSVREYNRLTGDETNLAKGERPVAIVVENTGAARPQWGINDEEMSPDIILQGEVEGGITRMLWFYSDMTKIPEKVGPLRSARPPYIKFSELFDAIFIHWGESHSADGYVGAKTVFKKDKVDHINQMTYVDEVGLYHRDTERNVSSEHTGYLIGSKVKDAIESKDFRTTSDYKGLIFGETVQDMGEDTCGSLTLTFSSRATEPITWKYNEEENKYHTDDFDTDVARDNLIVLFDGTKYQTKSNYQGAGGSVTYCNYKLGGGEGYIISNGTMCEITWAVEDGNLVFRHLLTDEQKEEQKKLEEKAEDGEEVEEILGDVVELNPGKTWIGWASANNGGKMKTTKFEKKAEKQDDQKEE